MEVNIHLIIIVSVLVGVLLGVNVFYGFSLNNKIKDTQTQVTNNVAAITEILQWIDQVQRQSN